MNVKSGTDIFLGRNCFSNNNITRGLKRAQRRLDRADWYSAAKAQALGLVLPKRSQAFFTKFLKGADTHFHLGGAAPVDLATEIAFRRSAAVRKQFGSLESFRDYYLNPVKGSLDQYLKRYHYARDYLFTTLEDIEEVTYQSCLNSYNNGSCLIELRTSIKSGEVGDPKSKEAMKDATFTPKEEFEAIVKGVLKAEQVADNGFRAFLVVSMRRSDSPEVCLKILEEAKEIRRYLYEKYGREFIVGIDIAGQEYGNKAKELAEVYRSAKKYNFKLTAHAGEDQGSGPGSILHAIDHLEVDRIGHGTSLSLPTPLLAESQIHIGKDGKVKNDFIRALQEGVAFEFCPYSNMICQAYYTAGFQKNPRTKRMEADLKPMERVSQYPFSIQMALGHLVYHGYNEIVPLVATDACFPLAGLTLAHEMARVADAFSLDLKTMMVLTYFQIIHSFAPDKDKNYILDNIWKPRARLVFGVSFDKDPVPVMFEHLNGVRADFRGMLSDSLGVDIDSKIDEIRHEVHLRDKYA